jgi:uncharacterized protein YjdB
MKKLFSSLIIVMMIALACVAVASAAEVYTPDADGLYTIEYDVTADDGTQFGMVVIEATGDEAFALNEGTIRYIDQVGAEDGAIAFDAFIPMDLKNEGTYKVYIGGGDLEEATFIGTLGAAASEEPTVSSVVLDKTAATIKVGETVTLTATVNDGLTPALTWVSDNTAVATVENGVVTAVKAGTANITVTAAEGVTATVAVTVTAAPAPSTKKGDINGDSKVNSKDCIYLLDYLTGDVEEAFANTDVNGDKKTNSKDVIHLLDYLTGDVEEIY